MPNIKLQNIEAAHYDASIPAVIAPYSGYLAFEEFKSVALHHIEILKRNASYKMLVDTSKMAVMPQQSQEWIEVNWFPRAVNAGLKHMAFLVPENVFGEISMQNANNQAEKKSTVNIKYFKDLSTARSWLKQQN
ncbi:STAS/SEC14 domain-containing protein [Limibacter armeniacum]|uniref:STAS/SEC14 domain-containing protein n=1 Tax=Limibacter armeniacum TaxID=466084 RepID=UPI002FE60A79